MGEWTIHFDSSVEFMLICAYIIHNPTINLFIQEITVLIRKMFREGS